MTTDIWTSSLIQELSDDDIKNFQDIALKDVKNKLSSDEEKTILNNNLDLWLYSLRVIRRDIELQLSNHKSNLKANIKDLRDNHASQDEIDQAILTEDRWRSNAMKFLTAVERKTLYVKLLIEDEEDK
jgi:UDP-N-acetylglucosamine pyrophosphorylase